MSTKRGKSGKFKLNKLVVVYWKDACSCDGWDSINSYLDHTPMECRTAGFLLESNKDYVTIAGTESAHRSLNQAMSIPKAWISKLIVVEDLSPKKPSKKKVGKKKLDK